MNIPVRRRIAKELQRQTNVAEKQYQEFNVVFNHDEKEEPVKIKKEGSLTIDESSIFYNNKYRFSEYKNVDKYLDDSLVSRCNTYLARFEHRMKELKKFTPRTVKTKMIRKIVYNNARKLYNMLLNSYFNVHNNTTDEEKEKMDEKFNPSNLLIQGQRFSLLRKEEKLNHSQKTPLLKE